ncbi:hypothetical protein PSK34_24020 [Escherichia coli]|nr:hypothetical protein [Escherichia coli]
MIGRLKHEELAQYNNSTRRLSLDALEPLIAPLTPYDPGWPENPARCGIRYCRHNTVQCNPEAQRQSG